MFRDVAFMAVHPSMTGLTIAQCSAADLPAGLNAPTVSQRWFRLVAVGTVGYVAASAVAVGEDDLEYGDPDFWEVQWREKAAELGLPVSDHTVGLSKEVLERIKKQGGLGPAEGT